MSIVQYRKKVELKCHQCGNPFESYPQAKYCSDKCRWKSNNEKRKQQRAVEQEKAGIVRDEAIRQKV